ncbi:MAG TPA: FtsW/RodA/SpoVE family cell cycle protein, partial [Pseudonocardiaceae bacterium]|nr:FtsW/RodA/SpoVE family cell cycle protein [Pseudonocardiaceae bacterium]
MATATEQRRREVGTAGFLSSVKRSLDRPATSYHLVLGASGLLLVLGLLMVLSASSVSSLKEYDSSYAIFVRQAMWVVAGIPLAWVASRVPLRLVRALVWPALLASIALIALTY